MKTKVVAAGVAGAGAAGFLAARAMRHGGGSEDGIDGSAKSPELRQHLSDLIALDNHLVTVLQRQAESPEVEEFPGARGIINTMLTTTSAQMASLEGCAEDLGGAGQSAVKSAVTSVTGMVTGLFDRSRGEPVSRMLRDDYAALNLCAVSNTMLHTTALGLGEQQVATVAQRNLEDMTPLIMQLNREIPRVVLGELSREGVPVDPTVGDQAIEDMQRAWQR
ncbi:MAG: DUF892 family protein [Chloroflexi bacterium]|nr:DUF892 family protein [Chloroflexota bacterium]